MRSLFVALHVSSHGADEVRWHAYRSKVRNRKLVVLQYEFTRYPERSRSVKLLILSSFEMLSKALWN